MRRLLVSCSVFAACASAPTPPPVTTIDLRPQFAAFGLPPRAQGPRPTCSVCTTVAAFEFALARAGGRHERRSVEFANWAANAATGRGDDGDFFHHTLAGIERFGLCRDALLPYAPGFDATAVPPPDALVDAASFRDGPGKTLQVTWLKPNDGVRGLDHAQYAALLATLRAGWPIAAGAAHSRLLVGYRDEAAAPGGGVFTTLDSALAAFGEVPAAYVRTEVCDAFAVTAALPTH